jgi:hypothetical protein
VLFGESAPPLTEGKTHAAFPGLVGLTAFGRAPDERGEEKCMEMQVIEWSDRHLRELISNKLDLAGVVDPTPGTLNPES